VISMPLSRYIPCVIAALVLTATFYRDVLPILQDHCRQCHDFQAYNAKAIAQMVQSRKMPPWFADPKVGHFSNDPSLTDAQIQTIVSWAAAGGPKGDPKDAPPAKPQTADWNISRPDRVIQMPKPVAIPARGDIPYTYEIVPTGFTEDKWIRMSQIRPSSQSHVHHAVVYVRPPNSEWLRDKPKNMPFTAGHEGHWTDSDMLLVYAPGSSPDQWPEDMAKFVPAGSDLVFQMHYTANGHAGQDQTSIGLVFAKEPPAKRVMTLQLTNDHFSIPPETDDYRVEAWGTLPNDAVLLSFFPHMHLRGKRFEYNIIGNKPGQIETLLRVNYDFHWQMSYRLARPRLLKEGTKLQAVAWYDNSRKNPHNPDPTATVTWGDQTYEEMMVGFFDIAVPRTVDKWDYFKRK